MLPFRGAINTKDLYGAVPSVIGGGVAFAAYMQAQIDAYGGVMWPFQEASGSVATAYNTALATGRNVLVDGDMEAATTAVWLPLASATLTKEIGTPHGGVRVLRIARNGVNNPNAYQAVLSLGLTYRVTGFARSDGNATPSIYAGGTIWTGTTSTSWQSFSNTFVAASANLQFFAVTNVGTEYVEFDDVTVTQLNILASSAYAPASIPMNGAYTGVTLAQSAGVLGLAPLFDGTNDYTNVYSATLNSFLNPAAGMVEVFGKVSAAGVWTDNTRRVLAMLYVDANNYISIEKNTSNQIEYTYKAGGTAETVTLAATPTGMFHAALKWNTGSYGIRAFYNGVQTGTDQTIAGTFTGNLAATRAVIGALNTSPASVWSGLITYPALYRSDPADSVILQHARSAGVA